MDNVRFARHIAEQCDEAGCIYVPLFELRADDADFPGGSVRVRLLCNLHASLTVTKRPELNLTLDI